MKSKLYFNKSLYQINKKDGVSFIIGETENFSVKGILSNQIISILLDAKKTEDELCAMFSGQFKYEEIYYSINQLLKKNIIYFESGYPENLNYFYTDISNFKKKNAVINFIHFDGQFINELKKIFTTNDIIDFKINEYNIKDILNGYELPENSISIVLTPDYLEPELILFNKIALKKNIDWIPLKCAGKIALFGPLFNNQNRNGCFNCLLKILEFNRKLESDYIKENKLNSGLRLSKAFTKNSIAVALHFFCAELFENYFIKSKTGLENNVYSIDFRESKIEKHQFTRLTFCPECGDYSNNKITPPLNFEKLQFKSLQKSEYNASGQRIEHAENSFEKNKKHISPITGAVNLLEKNNEIPDYFGKFYYAQVSQNTTKINFEKARILSNKSGFGKGKTDIQARMSALGEALERFSALYFGNEKIISAKYDDIKNIALNPADILLFSKNQYAAREFYKKNSDTAYIPEPLEQDTEIDWSPIFSITEEKWKLIPAEYIYFNFPVKNNKRFFGADSNGIAGGNCVEEAFLQGIFELIERDAIAMWWYNKLQKREIDLDSISDKFVINAARNLKKNGYTFHLLDLTNDIDIPVVAALAINYNENKVKSPGFGAHFDINIAIERAILEFGQAWLLEKKLNIDELCLRFQDKKFAEFEFLYPTKKMPKKNINEFKNYSTDDFKDDICWLTERFKGLGLETLFFDLTRKEIGYNVVRAVVPGLVHFWPRFAARRLYEVPVKMGWLEKPLTESELNPVPFYF